MNKTAKYLSLTACALAASLFLSGCGGAEGDDTVAPTVAITSAASGSTITFTFTFLYHIIYQFKYLFVNYLKRCRRTLKIFHSRITWAYVIRFKI